MPKKYGVNERDGVVAYIANCILTGKLRSGDRVDRNEIVRELGISRVPVQEALVQLEHDGVVQTRYHRGTYIERFDQSTLLEHHQLCGVLNGIVSARAAANPMPQVLEQLDGLMQLMRASKCWQDFAETAAEYRRAVTDAYAGPRLQAAIRATKSLVPDIFWMTFLDMQDAALPFYEAENMAIQRRDPTAARAACVGRASLLAQTMLSELIRRGVLTPEGNLSSDTVGKPRMGRHVSSPDAGAPPGRRPYLAASRVAAKTATAQSG